MYQQRERLYGAITGLAQTIDYDQKFQRDQYLTNLDHSLKAENQTKIDKLTDLQKTKFFGIPYIDRKLEQFSDQKSEEIGSIIAEYGDPFQNAEAMKKIKDIGAQYMDNEWVREGERVKSNIKQMEEDFAANLIDKEEFDSNYNKYLAYVQGEDNGEEREKFYYARPDRKTELEYATEVASKYARANNENYKTGINVIDWDADQLKQMAMDITTDYKADKAFRLAYQQYCQKNGITKPSADGYSNFIQQYIHNLNPREQTGRVYKGDGNGDGDGNGKAEIPESTSLALKGQLTENNPELINYANINERQEMIPRKSVTGGPDYLEVSSRGKGFLNTKVTDGTGKVIGATRLNMSGLVPYLEGQVQYPRNSLVSSYTRSIDERVGKYVKTGSLFEGENSKYVTLDHKNQESFFRDLGMDQEDIKEFLIEGLTKNPKFTSALLTDDVVNGNTLGTVKDNDIKVQGGVLADLINPASETETIDQKAKRNRDLEKYLASKDLATIFNENKIDISGKAILAYTIGQLNATNRTESSSGYSDPLTEMKYGTDAKSNRYIIVNNHPIDANFSQSNALAYNTKTGTGTEKYDKQTVDLYRGLKVDEIIPMDRSKHFNSSFSMGVKVDPQGQREVHAIVSGLKNKPLNAHEAVGYAMEMYNAGEKGLFNDMKELYMNSLLPEKDKKQIVLSPELTREMTNLNMFADDPDVKKFFELVTKPKNA
jgi:hypothetical protein